MDLIGVWYEVTIFIFLIIFLVIGKTWKNVKELEILSKYVQLNFAQNHF